MIKMLGIKRIVVLGTLLVLNALLGAGVYLYFVPEQQESKRELSSARQKVAKVQRDIDGLLLEFEQLEEQREVFETLRDDGLFNRQSRREAQVIFEDIQKKSGVTNALVTIESGVTSDDEDVKKAGYKILKSPVTIKLSALSDLEVYRYIYMLEQSFPGHVSIEKLDLDRVAEISSTILRAVASNENPPLVTANIDMLWSTMIPDDIDADDAGAK